MANPFKPQAKTGQERADARYDFPPNNSAPKGVVFEDAKVESRGERPKDNFIGAPARQVSETGKVRK
jgi:hypothetical protein